MGLIYLVRKKKFRTAEGIRELYFAIQRKLQKRGGKNEEDLAEILSANSSRSKGGSIEHPHRSAGRDRRDIEKWRIRIHQRVGIVSCLHYKQWLRASGRCIASRGTGIQSIFHCRPQVYPTCQSDEILSLPTIQILPKGLVTTRNDQGRRDSGRETGVHS